MHANAYQTATFTLPPKKKKKEKKKAIIQFIFPVLFAQNLFTMYTYMLHDGTMEKCTIDALPRK